MKIATVLVLWCLVCHSATGQDFWSHRIQVETDVHYGADSAQVADVYTQGERRSDSPQFIPASDARPTLIWIHGGGWTSGDKASHFHRSLHYLERGWHVVNINYRQGPNTAPQAVDDALCAYKWVVDSARKGPRRSNRFVVSGTSAGGHLALVIGLLNTAGDHHCRASVPPSAIVNWYGISDIDALQAYLAEARPDKNFALAWVGDHGRVADISARYSPLSLVTDSAPPIITIHGTADPVVPFEQSVALHSALSTPNRLIRLEGGTHGGFNDTQYQHAMTSIFEFLEEENANSGMGKESR